MHGNPFSNQAHGQLWYSRFSRGPSSLSAFAAATTPPPANGELSAAARRALALQVALDRAGFSPGEIDAGMGALTTRALAAFREARGIRSRGAALDPETVEALGTPYGEPLVKYTITDADVAGPFLDHIPDDVMQQQTLPALGYVSALEELAERFHVSPALLTRLNPHVQMTAESTIMVPAVEPLRLPHAAGPARQERRGRPARHVDRAHEGKRRHHRARRQRPRADVCTRHGGKRAGSAADW